MAIELPVAGRRTVMAGGAALALTGLPRPAQAARTRFVTANNNPYDILDPHLVFDIGRLAIRLNMYDALVHWVDNPPKLEFWLVETPSISQDGKTYTFRLRPGIKFHDGSAMTAEDVVYSMERILALKKGAYGLFKDFVSPGSTKALDAQTVQFNLNKPYAVFTAILSELWVVNPRIVKRNEKNGDWGSEWLSRNEAGSGSYRLRRFDPAIGFQAERYPDHFMGWHNTNWVDEAEFRVVMETATRVLGVIKGEFNTTDGYLPQEQLKRMQDAGTIKFIEKETLRTFYFIINNGKAPLDDVNMRKALCYAFDYDGFNEKILGGTVVRNPGIIPNPMWGAPKDLAGYTYDLDRAKHHLSLVKNVRPLQIGAMAGYPQSEQGAQLLQAGCAKIGLEVKIVAEPYTTIASKLDDPNRAHDLVPLWRSTYFADPHNWTGYLFNSSNFGAGNASFYKNPKVDELTNKALLVTEREQRRPLYEEVSRILVEDAAGLFVNNTKYFGPFTKNVKSVRYCAIGDAQDMRWVEMEA